VLEVGGGTGRLAAALAERESCRVWLVDPSPEMLEQARRHVPAGVGLKRGTAERLPFKDGWFERGVTRLSLHLWNRTRALPELRRVVRGRVALATFDPSSFERFWLHEYFPSIAQIDRGRFPDADALVRELRAAGFGEERVTELQLESELPRADALARIEGRHISTFELLDEEEVRRGTEAARAGLPELVRARQDWLIVSAE
jgi:SAM-dependent methyltransferase